jgi:hypothetical protein
VGVIWRYRIAAVSAAIIIATPSYSAHAEFINQYSQWHDLDKTSKALYADGLIDGGILYKGKCVITLVKAPNSCLAQMDGMIQCIMDNKLNGNLLAEMIDNAYAKDVTQWAATPADIITVEMEKLCQPWLQHSRQKMGASE